MRGRGYHLFSTLSAKPGKSLDVYKRQEYRPEDVEYITAGQLGEPETVGDTVRLVSWNVGYCGLGENEDLSLIHICPVMTTSIPLHSTAYYIQAAGKNQGLIFATMWKQTVDFSSRTLYTVCVSAAWEGQDLSEELDVYKRQALVIFTVWRPSLSILASILFGGLYILHLYIPAGMNLAVKELYKMLPYLVTIAVLIISSLRKKRENDPPAHLGLAYFREDR